MKKMIKARFQRQPPALVRWGSIIIESIPLMLGVTGDGAICRLEFAKNKSARTAPTAWRKAWASTVFVDDPDAIQPVIKALTGNKPLDLLMIGTPFQESVWRQLLAIPSGKTITYAELARRIGKPKAVRAVGSACGANPVAILVPCHRVIASDGGLGGYAGGLSVKKKLLQKERLEA